MFRRTLMSVTSGMSILFYIEKNTSVFLSFQLTNNIIFFLLVEIEKLKSSRRDCISSENNYEDGQLL